MTLARTADPVLIDLDQPKRGYRLFITCWLHRAAGETLVVDPGPASTIDHLIGRLRDEGVERLDRIVLTHIHLDHGGGAGHLAAAFPEARVVCHAPSAKHLIDPARLWEGSLKVLGENATLFGEPLPVAADRIDKPASLETLGIRTIPTPGHAPHHLSFLHGDLLFAGEAAGMTCPGTSSPYMRPATPPRFFLDVAEGSLDRLLALDPAPSRAAFAHYGLHDDPMPLLRAARVQLGTWVEELDALSQPGERVRTPELQERALARLMEVDPYFAPFAELPDDIRDRELDFITNTIDGMLGWLALRDAD